MCPRCTITHIVNHYIFFSHKFYDILLSLLTHPQLIRLDLFYWLFFLLLSTNAHFTCLFQLSIFFSLCFFFFSCIYSSFCFSRFTFLRATSSSHHTTQSFKCHLSSRFLCYFFLSLEGLKAL